MIVYNVSFVSYEDSLEVSVYDTLISDTVHSDISILYPDRPTHAAPGCRLLPVAEIEENPFEPGTYIYQEILTPEELEERRVKNMKDSQHRAQNNARAIALSNKWDAFLTLTFDDSKAPEAGVDYDVALKYADRALRTLRAKYSALSYLLVPEQGERRGRWHFHALVAGLPREAYVFSGHKTKSHEMIYNLPDWKYGYTTATFVRSNEKVSRYIAKYITKSNCVPFRRKRYLCSRGLHNALSEKIKYLFDGLVVSHLVNECGTLCTYQTKYNMPTFSCTHSENKLFHSCRKFYLPKDSLYDLLLMASQLGVDMDFAVA